MRVSLGNSRFFEAGADQFILDAGLHASLRLPHSCRGGNCGACRAQLLSGEIHYPHGPPLGLSEAEIAGGMILLCQALARTDLCIDVLEWHAAGATPVKRLPCRIERTVRLSHDVMGLWLRLPAAEDFDFRAGQYIDVLLTGGRRRSFSIASPPGNRAAHRLLELHVRRVADGAFSEPLFRDDTPHALLTVEGPFGQFVHQQGVAAPLLFVCGGTGLAPCLCILRDLIERGIEHEMTLYFGVRGERDLYARDAIEALISRATHLRYVPVLSEPSVDWQGARGLVHRAVLDDFADLRAHEIYAAGPPAMIDSLRRDFVARGADPQRIHVDSFDYARDPEARHRSNVDTNS